MEIMEITGHYKTLTRDEWIEGYHSFIRVTKSYIARAKSGEFGRDYYLLKAEQHLELAKECLNKIS